MRFLIILILLTSNLIFSESNNREEKKEKNKSKLELLSEVKSTSSSSIIDLDSRHTKSVIYSLLIPGSGQFYIGQEWKGAGFTLAFFGAALTAVLNHNNFIGREDRLKTLTESYANAGNYYEAEIIWKDISKEKAQRNNDYNRRKYFTYAAIGIWALNLVDIIFFSEDKGENSFSKNKINSNFSIAFESNNHFNSFAFKVNLPKF
jgi:hypothetical protein